MNLKFEMEQNLLTSAIEVMRDAMNHYEADAAALARLDTPEALELAQERLASAKTAETLLFFFGTR